MGCGVPCGTIDCFQTKERRSECLLPGRKPDRRECHGQTQLLPKQGRTQIERGDIAQYALAQRDGLQVRGGAA